MIVRNRAGGRAGARGAYEPAHGMVDPSPRRSIVRELLRGLLALLCVLGWGCLLAGWGDVIARAVRR